MTRNVLERMSGALRGDLEDQVLRQAILLDEATTQGRTRALLDGFWSELAAVASLDQGP